MKRMLHILHIVIVAGVLLGLALGATACGSACKDLANKICKCQPTRSKENACKRSTSAAKRNLELSSKEEDACQEILDSGDCTCQALQAGDLAACGLAHDAELVFE